jgi:predicted nucleic acid-binding protein
VLYLDSSAIVKLVAPEPESEALVARLRSDPEPVSSALASVEVLRAVRRTGDAADTLGRAEAVLDRIALVPIEAGILRIASRLEPTDLRTLDAIHLATALTLGPEVAGLVTYDAGLAQAATLAGLVSLAPA